MYEGDAPLAERRAAALALDRDLLRDLLGAEELRELLDADVLADVELELQCLADGRRARSADELHDVLRRVGDLSMAEIDLRCEGAGSDADDDVGATSRARPPQLTRRRRGNGSTRCWPRSGRSRSRSAVRSGTPPARTPPGIAMRSGVRCRSGCRWRSPSRSRGRWRNWSAGTPAPTGRSWSPTSPAGSVPTNERIIGAIVALEAAGRIVLGEFRPDGVSREYCDVDVLRQLRRRSLASLRREVEPVEQRAFARFLPAWHNIPAERRGMEAFVEALGVLSGAALVASTIEADVFPARVRGYSSSMLDELCTAGELVWVGAGGLGARDGRVRLCFADQLAQLAPSWEHRDPPEGVLHDAVRAHLSAQGASFWGQLRGGGHGFVRCRVARRPVGSRVGRRGDQRFVRPGACGARRSVAEGRRTRRQGRLGGRPRPGRLNRIGPPAGQGRWSLVAPLLLPGADTDRGGARAGTPARRTVRRGHPRGGARRGRRRRFLQRVRRVEGARGARPGAPRVLRRRARRGTVRRSRSRRSASRANGKRPIPRSVPTTFPPRSSWRPPIRHSPTALRWRGRRRRAVRPARRTRWSCSTPVNRWSGSTARAAIWSRSPARRPTGHGPMRSCRW